MSIYYIKEIERNKSIVIVIVYFSPALIKFVNTF